MTRFLACILAVASLLPVIGAAAGGADTVYQRTQRDGAVSLTNVPDGEGYQVLVVGAPPTASSGGANDSGAPSSGLAGQGQSTPVLPPPQRAEPVVPSTVVVTPPSIEARTGKLLDPEAATSLAYAQSSQAQEEIISAGGAQARMQSLYQASLSAFQAKRSVPQDRR